jgi:hypothetical protein
MAVNDSDDPFFAPGHRAAPRVPRAGEVLFEFVRASDRVPMACELRYHGEFGVEAQFLERGEFLIGRRFDTGAQAVRWAELERQAIETGEPEAR